MVDLHIGVRSFRAPRLFRLDMCLFFIYAKMSFSNLSIVSVYTEYFARLLLTMSALYSWEEKPVLITYHIFNCNLGQKENGIKRRRNEVN